MAWVGGAQCGMVVGSTFQSRGQFADVVRVLPVAEARQVAVGAAFPVVLGGGLAVHLQDPAAGPAQHAAQQVQVVDLAGRGRGLARTGRSPAARWTAPGRRCRRSGPPPGCPQRRRRRSPPPPPASTAQRVPASSSKPEGVVARCSPHPPSRWRGPRGPGRASGQGWCRAGRPGGRRRGGRPRCRADRRTRSSGGRARPSGPGPGTRAPSGSRPCCGRTGRWRRSCRCRRSEPGWPSAPKDLLQRRRRRGGAQPGVAVHVRRADPGLSDHGQGVVLLQEQLPAGVEAVAERAPARAAVPGCGPRSGPSPCPSRISTSAPFSRTSGRVRRSRCGHALPAGEEALRSEPAVVDQVAGPARGSRPCAVLDGDVAGAAIAAQHAGGLHPPVDVGSPSGRRRAPGPPGPATGRRGHTASGFPRYWRSGQPCSLGPLPVSPGPCRSDGSVSPSDGSARRTSGSGSGRPPGPGTSRGGSGVPSPDSAVPVSGPPPGRPVLRGRLRRRGRERCSRSSRHRHRLGCRWPRAPPGPASPAWPRTPPPRRPLRWIPR